MKECLLGGKVVALLCVYILDLFFCVNLLFLPSFFLCVSVHCLVPGFPHNEPLFPLNIEYLQCPQISRGVLVRVSALGQRC